MKRTQGTNKGPGNLTNTSCFRELDGLEEKVESEYWVLVRI